MTAAPLPCETERAAGNAALAARVARAEPIDTAPPLQGDELRRKQRQWRKAHGLVTP